MDIHKFEPPICIYTTFTWSASINAFIYPPLTLEYVYENPIIDHQTEWPHKANVYWTKTFHCVVCEPGKDCTQSKHETPKTGHSGIHLIPNLENQVLQKYHLGGWQWYLIVKSYYTPIGI